MMLRLRIWPCAAILAAIFCFSSSAHAALEYTISLAHPERHVLGVTMRIPSVRGRVTVQMPAWNALYQIRDFSSHMTQLSAKDAEGNPLAAQKLDKETWSISGNGDVTIAYPILWDEPGPFASQLNPDHAFLNFAMVLLYVPDRRAEESSVVFEDVPPGWRVAIELDSSGTASAHRSSTYVAPSYDALVDAPQPPRRFGEQLQGTAVMVERAGVDTRECITNPLPVALGDER